MTGYGALAGLCFSMGITSIVLYEGPWRALYFSRRVNAALHPSAVRQRVITDLARRLGSTRTSRIERRQLQAGIPVSATAHILRCVIGATIGSAFGLLVMVVLTQLQQVRRPAALALLLLLAGISGWLWVDHRLSMMVKRRQQGAAVALPNFVESLALAVTAGATLPKALQLVSARSDDAFSAVVASHMTSGGLDSALRSLREMFPLPAIVRLVDAISIAVERGTPIADVLHSQANDAREESRRLLLERAGRREVGMLIPVIFFVLPAVVVVALYPGFQELSSIAT